MSREEALRHDGADDVPCEHRSMEQFLQSMAQIDYPDIGDGHYYRFDDVFSNVVNRNHIEHRVMNGWWSLLKEYVGRDDCIVFIRRYGNERPRSNLRRGFFTRCPSGFGYVYCDNKLSHYFYTMARAGFVPTLDEFSAIINDRIMPYGNGGTREENELQAYRHGRTTRINSSGWYLPHIFSADDPCDYLPEYTVSRQLFDRGSRDQWILHEGEDYYVRDLNRNFTDEERRIFTAHFLRLVNPMNHFLMPWQKWQRTIIDGRVIGQGLGEYKDFLAFMRLMRRAELRDTFEEFENMIMCLPYQGVADVTALGQRAVDYTFSHNRSRLTGQNRQNASEVRYRTIQTADGGKAIQRIPLWSQRIRSVPYRVIRAYLLTRDENMNSRYDAILNLCSDRVNHPELFVEHFLGSWSSLKTDAGNSYGQVFLQNGNVVSLVPSVSVALRIFENNFLR